MTMVGTASNAPRMRQVRIILTILLGIFLVYSLLPLYYVMVSSTKADGTLFSSFGLWFSGRFALWDNLVLTFTYGNGIFGRWLWNTLWYSVLSAVGSALFATAAGYAFAKYQFVGRRAFFAVILGSIMIPGTALVIPTFLLLSNMGLVNTPWAVILPSLTTPLGVFLMRVYADSAVPDELIDAARIEGAGEFTILTRIAFRLMVPAFITVLLLSFVGAWNNYFLPLVMLSNDQLYPVTVGLSTWYSAASGGSGAQALFSMVLTGAFVTILPIAVAFVLLQRFWQADLGAGGVK
jgi:multiple sugar transport system permease protein